MEPESELIAFAPREAMAAKLADLIEVELMRGIHEGRRGEIAVPGGDRRKKPFTRSWRSATCLGTIFK